MEHFGIFRHGCRISFQVFHARTRIGLTPAGDMSIRILQDQQDDAWPQATSTTKSVACM